MNTINIPLTVSPDYKNEFVDINKKQYDLSFELQDGTHTVSTPLLEVGKLLYFNNSTLLAKLSFSYDFDAANKILTISGTEYSSEDSMCLTTVPKGTEEIWYQRTTESTTNDKKLLFNPNWNYSTHMTPNLDVIFAEIVKAANNILIDAVKDLDGLTIQIKTPPPVLTPEEHSKLLVVYKENQFAGLYNPNVDYGTDFTVNTIESVWGGTVRFSAGENFANVIGSTPDPKIGGNSWIGLWTNQFGVPTICTSYNYGGFICNTGLVGGHIILGTLAKVVAKGSNSVYIMPICSAHNNNNAVYMAALQYRDGIWLNNYLN